MEINDEKMEIGGMSQGQVKRIVLTGPESTGKSVLSGQLAAQYDTVYVPEYAREYLSELNRPYREEDLLLMAQEQIRLEDLAASRARNGLLFCDTGLYVMKIWSEHKYGRCHPWILQQIATRHYDLFLLCNIDMRWDEDPLREHPDPLMRQYFFNLYRETLAAAGQPFAIVNGLGGERLRAAMNIIEAAFYSEKG